MKVKDHILNTDSYQYDEDTVQKNYDMSGNRNVNQHDN
jgi:hypothetical protein